MNPNPWVAGSISAPAAAKWAATGSAPVTITTGTAVETDTGLSVSRLLGAGTAVESDTACRVSLGLPAGISSESDAALGVGAGVQPVAAVESDAARPVGVTAVVGVAAEADAALPVTVGSVAITAGTAVEADTAGAASVGVSVGTGSEADVARPVSVAIGVAAGTAAEADVCLAPSLATQAGTASEADVSLGVSLGLLAGLGTEGDAALGVAPILQVGVAAETDAAQPVGVIGATFLAGTATEADHALAATLARNVTLRGTAQGCRFDDGSGDIIGPSRVALEISAPVPDSAPGPLNISVSAASPAADLTFTIGADTVWVDVADAYGNLMAATIDLPLDMMAGTYTLTVTTVENGTDSVDFTLASNPDPLPDALPADLSPVPVDAPGRWVFQDRMPGGLGSWVLPVNPTTMSNPHYEKNVSTTHSTSASQGQVIVSEGAYVGRPWRIAGYCPDQDFYSRMMSFCSIRRRFYVQDHHGRIWVAGVQTLASTPRQRQSDAVSIDNDWASNYDLTLVLYSQQPVTS